MCVSVVDMLVNSSVSNESFLGLHHVSAEPSFPSYMHCYTSGTSAFIYSSFLITHICLLLPLCVFILAHGFQQWWRTGSSSSSAAVSHSDCFAYHMAAMQLVGVFGCAVCFSGIYGADMNITAAGNMTFCINWFGEMFFHVLTCLERYVAAVHPIAYRNLRNERGIRIRNTGAACVWPMCVIAVMVVMLKVFFYMDIFLLVLSLTAASFCSVSVLWVLIRPSPGTKRRGREAVDQSKQRAFNTIVAVFGAVVVRFIFNIIWEVVYLSQGTEACVILACCNWFNLPSSLVLPLLLLHRTGTFEYLKNIFKCRTGTQLHK